MLAGLAVLLVLLLGAVWLVARSLDRPWVKGRLQALVRDKAGVDLDYRTAEARLLGGLSIDGLTVRSPERFRAAAPHLLRVERIEAAWSRRSLFGSGPPVTSVSVRGLELTVAHDARDGVHSLMLIGGEAPPEPEPATPISRLLAAQLDKAPPLGKLQVEDVTVVLVRTDGPRVLERWRLTGLGAGATVDRAAQGWRLAADLGTQAAPLTLALRRAQDQAANGAATLRLWLSAEATSTRATARLGLTLVEQSLVKAPPVKELLGLDAAGTFAPAEGRSAFEVKRLAAADGAVTATARLELPDGGEPPFLREAAGDADLVKLLALLPEELRPLRARVASATFSANGLELTARPRLRDGGAASVEAKLDDVSARLEGLSVEADRGAVTLRATPGPEGKLALHARVPLGQGRLTAGRRRVAAASLTLGADGSLAPDGTIDGKVSLAAAALDLDGGPSAGVRGAKLQLDAEALRLDERNPLASRGRLRLGGGADSLLYSQPGTRVAADGAAWKLEARLTGAPPYGLTFDLPLARLRVWSGGKQPLVDGPAQVTLAAREVKPDLARPLATRGELDATLRLGAIGATVKATKLPDAVDFDVGADAKSLAALALVAPGDADFTTAWERIGLQLHSKGRVDSLAKAPSIKHDTQLTLTRPSFRARDRAVTMTRAALTLRSAGTARRHAGDAALRIAALTVGDKAQGDLGLDARFAFDAGAPSASLTLDAKGQSGPTAAVKLALAFDRAKRALGFDLDLRADQLGPVEPFLAAVKPVAGFQLAKLGLEVRGDGHVFGLVSGVGPGGTPRLVADPLKTLAVEGKLAVGATGLRWRDRDRRLEVPRVGWRGKLTTRGTSRMLHGELDLAGLVLVAGKHRLEIEGVRDSLDLKIDGDLRLGAGEISEDVTLATLRQDVAPAYSVGQVRAVLKASRDADGVIRLDDLKLENGAAGSSITASGGLDLSGGRRGLSLRGTLQQDLSRLWTARQSFVGRGRVGLTLQVESGSLRLYHAAAALQVEGGHIELPRNGIKLERVAGEIPLAADFTVGKRVRLVREAAVNAYSEVRFADQHPLLSKRSFLSVGLIETPLGQLGPLAGNLRVEQNLISLSQLELSLRNGRVTGRCLLDWNKEDTQLHLQLRASRVEASRGEPFDGNIAVVVSSAKRSVEGRAEILRIGRRHLLDLLDLTDPYHRDAAINRVRRALALGYPDRVRIDFDHGFASARITFGGLARLIRIDPIRGIPMGPIIDKVLAPLVDDEAEEE